MIGVTGTNLMNYYFTMLNIGISGGVGKITPNGKGDVTLSSAPSSDALCVEPVKSITSSVALTDDVYFVPAFDFAGIKVNGSTITTTSVVADGKSLYKLSSGSVTKISL